MHLEFHGAAGGVTGSAHLLVTDRASVLLDFGMFQGGPAAEIGNRRRPGFDVRALDAVVLSHAHVDHSGRLPLLPRWGASPPVWCTPATADLCRIMLPDSAQVAAHDARRWQRRRERRGRPVRADAGGGAGRAGDSGGARQGPQPLYDQEDVAAVLERLRPLPYGRSREIAAGITLEFQDAGHILGSSIVVLDVAERGSRRRVVFCGDLGHRPAPLLRDPQHPGQADVLLLESTYGDRDHRSEAETLAEFRAVVLGAQDEGGKVLVPAFAVGRTQEVVYHLAELHREGALRMPVFVDSPMASATTELYRRHGGLLDDQARELIEGGEPPLDFPGLRYTRTPDESMALNELRGPAVIVSASGMCSGGRIVHHLRHHAPRRGTRILMVGFQAVGTPGRALVDGAREIKLMGERVEVNASVHTLGGFSAHAGQSELLEWTGRFERGAGGQRPRTFLVHGEDKQRQALAARLADTLGMRAELPGPGARSEL
jgi:metallo-beta-lactamase family protein